MMKNWKRVAAFVCAAVLCVALVAGCSSQEEKTYTVLSEDLGAENYGVGFRQEDVALGLEVQKILDEMIADGTAAEISQKWFQADILLKDAEFFEETQAPEGDDSLEKIKAAGVLILGLDDSFPPMGFRDENNEITGFDIDLAKEVTKRLGVELEVQPIDWDAKEMELSTGKIDCIWNGMTVTDERLENMFFAKPYVANRQVVIVPEGSDIKTIADLAGKKVGLQKGSSSLEALEKNPVSAQVSEISQYPENITAFMDLQAGRVDAFVVDEVVGRYIISQQ